MPSLGLYFVLCILYSINLHSLKKFEIFNPRLFLELDSMGIPGETSSERPQIAPEAALKANILAFKRIVQLSENRTMVSSSEKTFYLVFESGELIRELSEYPTIPLRDPERTTIIVLDRFYPDGKEMIYGKDYESKRVLKEKQDTGVIYHHYPADRQQWNGELASAVDLTVLQILRSLRNRPELRRFVQSPHSFGGSKEESYESAKSLRRSLEDELDDPPLLRGKPQLPCEAAVRSVVKKVTAKIGARMFTPIKTDYYFDPLHFLTEMVGYFVDEMRTNVLYLLDISEPASPVRIIAAHDWRMNGLRIDANSHLLGDPKEKEYRLHTDPALLHAFQNPKKDAFDFPQPGAGIDRVVKIHIRDVQARANTWLLAFDDRELPREYDELDKELQLFWRDVIMFRLPFLPTRQIVEEYLRKTRSG